MNILLLGLLFFFNIFSESLDEAVFLIETPEYDRKFIFGDNQIGASFYGSISYFYFSQPSLLAQRCTVIQYVQQFYDLVFGMSVEDYLLGKVDLRTRIVWGSSEPEQLDERGLNFLGVEYGDHSHGIGLPGKNFFWIREGWVDLDISRFMCLDRSINLVIGTIPYMLGRGISYGVVYAELPGFIGADSGAVIEEFAPAILLSTEIYSNKNHTLFGDLYCGILTNWSGSYEQNIEPIYEKRIWHCPVEPERGFGHVNVALIGQLKYEAINKYGKLYVEPYVLCNLNPEANIVLTRNNFSDLIYEYDTTLFSGADIQSLSSSKLITLGCMIDWQSKNFCFNLEFAINKGGLFIYGRDKNNLEVGKIPAGGIQLISNTKVLGYYDGLVDDAIANEINQKIIENSPQGAEFNGTIINEKDPRLANKFTRFQDPKKINYQGAMGVFDFAYWCIEDEFVLSTTMGFATGGGFEVETYPIFKGITGEKLSVDNCGNYGGFISLQELYTGLWVQSAFGAGGPFKRPSLFSNTDGLDLNKTLFFKELFTDFKFFGISANLFPSVESSLSINILNYWSFCTPNEVFIPDDYTEILLGLADRQKTLPRELGIEIFILGKYKFIEEFTGFLAYAIFFPGDRFADLSIPNDYFDFYELFNDKILYDNLQQGKIKFNPVYLFNVGFEYIF